MKFVSGVIAILALTGCGFVAGAYTIMEPFTFTFTFAMIILGIIGVISLIIYADANFRAGKLDANPTIPVCEVFEVVAFWSEWAGYQSITVARVRFGTDQKLTNYSFGTLGGVAIGQRYVVTGRNRCIRVAPSPP